MKKLLLVLFVIALVVSLFVGCIFVTPDGDEGEGEGKIAFASDRDVYYPEIYLMNADGSKQTRITNNQAWNSDPSWSP